MVPNTARRACAGRRRIPPRTLPSIRFGAITCLSTPPIASRPPRMMPYPWLKDRNRRTIRDNVSALIDHCEVLDLADELREARRWARQQLRWLGRRPRDAEVAGLARDQLEACASDRVGYLRRPAPYGGERLFFRCAACHAAASKLYRPIGTESFRCRRCWQVRYPDPRGYGGHFGRFPRLAGIVQAFEGPGRRPRRFHRAAAQLQSLVMPALSILTADTEAEVTNRLKPYRRSVRS